MEGVKSYAVWKEVIVGEAGRGFFIFDTATSGRDLPRPEFFESRDHWERALDARGIPKDIELLDPDDVAATKSNREIRPWEYAVMKGLLGLCDEAWAGFVLLGTFAFSVTLGCTGIRVLLKYLVPVFVGALGGYVAWTISRYADTPMLAALPILTPVYCLVAVCVGQIIRAALKALLRGKRSRK